MSNNWQDIEIEFLIELYKDNKARVDGMYNKTELYLEFEKKFVENGYNRSHQQIKKKIANLKSDYRKFKPGSTGAAPSNWKWYNPMHEILGTRHFYNQGLASTFDSMESSQEVDDWEQNANWTENDINLNEDYGTSSSTSTIETTPRSSKRKYGSNEETNKKICQFIESFGADYKKSQEKHEKNSEFLMDQISEMNKTFKDLVEIFKPN